MAEASRILQTTLIPTFSQNPSLYAARLHSHGTCFIPSTAKRSAIFDRIRCSVSTASSGAVQNTALEGVPWGCDVDSPENAAALQEWLSECGLPPQKMGIQKVEVGERGLVALNNIRKGEKLLFVPPSLFITADSVSLIASSLITFFLKKIKLGASFPSFYMHQWSNGTYSRLNNFLLIYWSLIWNSCIPYTHVSCSNISPKFYQSHCLVLLQWLPMTLHVTFVRAYIVVRVSKVVPLGKDCIFLVIKKRIIWSSVYMLCISIKGFACWLAWHGFWWPIELELSRGWWGLKTV